jgi:hypothetical protein
MRRASRTEKDLRMKFQNCDQRVLRVPMNRFDLHCNVLEVMNVTVLSKGQPFFGPKIRLSSFVVV